MRVNDMRGALACTRNNNNAIVYVINAGTPYFTFNEKKIKKQRCSIYSDITVKKNNYPKY